MRRFFLILALLAVSLGTCMAQWDRDVFEFRGRGALADGKWALAIENFNHLARLDTTDYWTFFYRGIAKYNLGDIRGAQKDFDNSVRLNPVFTNGYHYRAITLSRFGRYDEALDDLQRAIDLRPGQMGLYFSRGVTYFLSQQFESAVKDFDRYIKKEPKDPSAYLNRGASYLFLGDTLKAVSDYNKAIRLDRFEPEGYIRRGRLYAAQGRFEDALKDMDKAVELDSTSTLAYFNRALMHYEAKDYNAAMSDLNRVLRDEPGNALTLYNRSLISAQVGDYDAALRDMDRVIDINPGNVLAYFNRAAFFMEMGRWADALDDYDRAIELYPDFAKAYLNRSYVENLLGMKRASEEDYRTAGRKIAEYRAKTGGEGQSFADTTRKYSSLIALDGDFAKKDFDNELLQHRDIDIRLKPLYKFRISSGDPSTRMALSRRYENPLIDRFMQDSPVPIDISNRDSLVRVQLKGSLANYLYGDSAAGAGKADLPQSEVYFIWGLSELQNKQYSSALNYMDMAVRTAEEKTDERSLESLYKAFYLLNRGALRAEMIDIIASIQSNVQTLKMDDKGATRARVNDRTDYQYDYSEAIDDLLKAVGIVPDIPYFHYNLGNLYCLSSQLPASIASYTEAIRLYPYMGDAFYNRGLVLIYLKDKEKGCIDLSRAGELGIPEAYGVIKKYCEEERQ
ncbi:MAG: tetratricopeptide repeat protein [Bacteroidales bacterium]|nr:tetratricopeptide repeat protein [Bacteroidales bacterium]